VSDSTVSFWVGDASVTISLTLLLSRLDPKEYIIYDDACHFVRYVRKPDRLKDLSIHSDIPQQIAKAKFYVDKFHHRNHKLTDKYCQENCNPANVPFLGERFSS
jgi:hypothetical protein